MRNPVLSAVKRVARYWPAPVVARRRGARFLLNPRNWIDNRLLAGAPFEDAQIENARALIRSRRIDLVVDIGANIGLYTVGLGLKPQVRNVIAFEPVRRNFAQLMGNVFLNGLSGRVDAHRLALGAGAGKATIHIDPTSTGVSRLDLETAERDTGAFIEHEEIEIARFDDVCDVEGRRAFVKIDVEGGAVGVLTGMSRFMSRNDPVFQIEVSPAEESGVERLMRGLGFKEILRIDRDAIFVKA